MDETARRVNEVCVWLHQRELRAPILPRLSFVSGQEIDTYRAAQSSVQSTFSPPRAAISVAVS